MALIGRWSYLLGEMREKQEMYLDNLRNAAEILRLGSRRTSISSHVDVLGRARKEIAAGGQICPYEEQPWSVLEDGIGRLMDFAETYSIMDVAHGLRKRFRWEKRTIEGEIGA